MFDAIVELVPAEWRATVTVLLSPLRWIPELQATLLRPSMIGDSVAGIALVSTALLLPALLVIVGLWCTMLSLYTLPFRSGRGQYITALLLAWWDAGRCIWLFWMGFVRVGVALVGWIIGMLRFGWLFLKNLVVGMVRSPFSLLDMDDAPLLPARCAVDRVPRPPALDRRGSDHLHLHAQPDAE